MAKQIQISDKKVMEIAEFTTDGGTVLHTLRQMYYTKEGKLFPQKTKSGGFSSISLTEDGWLKAIQLLQDYFQLAGASEADLSRLAGGGKKTEDEF